MTAGLELPDYDASCLQGSDVSELSESKIRFVASRACYTGADK